MNPTSALFSIVAFVRYYVGAKYYFDATAILTFADGRVEERRKNPEYAANLDQIDEALETFFGNEIALLEDDKKGRFIRYYKTVDRKFLIGTKPEVKR